MSTSLECVKLLLTYDAPVDAKNLQGQTPLNEAISYGDRAVSKCRHFSIIMVMMID